MTKPQTPSQDPAPAQPAFVLVRPQMGENIGAAARAMLNFGLTRMRLVAPRDGWPNPRAAAMASGASGKVLDMAGVFATTTDAVADADFVFATTARGRDLIKPVFTPEAAMARAREMIAAGGLVAVLFGPERAGLENDDVARANAIVSVPVNPDFASLNLAQAVLLLGYEWRRGGDATPGEVLELAGTEMASRIEIDKLGDHYEEKLAAAGYFYPETRVASQKLSLRNLWGRLPLTRADVQVFHGILRQVTRAKGGSDGDNGSVGGPDGGS